MRSRRRVPWTLAAITAVTVLAYRSDSVAYALEDRSPLDPPGPSAIEAWRPLTGHAVHGSLLHLVYNLTLLVPLLLWRERRFGSRQTLLEYLILATSVALGVRLLHEGWTSYRGLSGVAYGFLALYLLHAARAPNTDGAPRRWHALPLLVLAAITTKTLLECAAGGWILRGDDVGKSLGVVLLPGAHLAGLVAATVLHTIQDGQRSPDDRTQGAASSRADLAGSAAPSRAPITATPEAPARRSSSTRSSRTPPSA